MPRTAPSTGQTKFSEILFWIFIDPADPWGMKDLHDDIRATPLVVAPKTPEANPRAASVRLEARSMSRAKGARRHDYRIGKAPGYVDTSQSDLNRILFQLRPLFQIRDENAALRAQAGRQRAMKSNAAVVSAGIISFGTEAARMFERLTPEAQDAAFLDLAEEIAERLDTRLESLVVHCDETTSHAHFMLRAYTDAGLPLSDTMKAGTTSALQDLTAEVMAHHCPGIERGHHKRDRLAAGADYAATLHRSVRQLHADLPAEIAAREAELDALTGRAVELEASIAKTKGYLNALTAKAALSEKEEKRLKTYAARLEKKEEELAAVERSLDAKRQRVEAAGKAVEAERARVRAAASELDSEREKVVRAGQEAGKVQAEARVQVARAKARETAAAVNEAEFGAGIGAQHAMLAEIAAGTMRVKEDGKVTLENRAVLQNVPRPLLDRLMPPMIRLVKLIDETHKRADWLARMRVRVTAWLGREDLTAEARREGEELDRDLGM